MVRTGVRRPAIISFDIGELGGGALHHTRFRPHAAARGDRPEHQVAGRDREQVGRDRLWHLEAVAAIAHCRRIVVGAHQHHRICGRGDVRPVRNRTCGVSCSGTHERAWIACDWLNMNGASLAVGHFRRKPLQPGGIGRGRIADPDTLIAIRHLDRQFAAEERVLRGQPELQRLPASVPGLAFDLFDCEVAGIEQQAGRGLVAPLERVGCSAGNAPRVKVDVQLEREVRGADFFRLGVRLSSCSALLRRGNGRLADSRAQPTALVRPRQRDDQRQPAKQRATGQLGVDGITRVALCQSDDPLPVHGPRIPARSSRRHVRKPGTAAGRRGDRPTLHGR